jgi:endo-1,4-beta-xylanase
MTRCPIRLLACILAAFCALAAVRAQAPAASPAPETWLGEPDYPSFRLEGEEARKADLALVTLHPPPGEMAGFRFTIHAPSDIPLAIQAVAPNPRAVTARSTLFAHFFMRTVATGAESGEGKLQFILENAKTFDKSIQFPAVAGSEWKEFNLPFAALGNYPPGAAHVIFRLGYGRQTVEIAGLKIEDYGPGVAVGSLPASKPDLSYAGMAPDAPWRAAAEARIQKIRRSPLTVQVVDAGGEPVAGAAVEIRQTRHAFLFGSAISVKNLLDSVAGPDKRFSEAVLDNFNIVTFENALKWPHWEQNRESPLEAARWCQEHHVALRAHNMIWPSWRYLPAAVQQLRDKPEALRQAILRHVAEIGAAMAPYAAIWDVVNEPFTNHDLMDLLGNGILTDIYRQARESAPSAKLFINDYGIVTGNGLDHKHQDGYARTIQYLLDQKAPLEGIGLQGHFGQEFTPPERIYEILDRFAQFHLPLEMTEFTADADDRELDATFLRDVMTILFSHPAVNGFSFWGFYDAHGYEHKATLYDADGQLTPAGKVYRELVFHRWWTREDVTTAADGAARVDGFHGRYEITVSKAGKQVKQAAELGPGGATVKIVLGQ